MRTRLSATFAASLLASTLILGSGAAAQADTVTTCGDQLTALQSDVLAVPITSGKVEKERAGLVKLVSDATALVDAGKTTDAVVKLGDLQVLPSTLEDVFIERTGRVFEEDDEQQEEA